MKPSPSTEKGYFPYEVFVRAKGADPKVKLNREEAVEIRLSHRITISEEQYTLWSAPLRESIDNVLGRLWEIFEIFVDEMP